MKKIILSFLIFALVLGGCANSDESDTEAENRSKVSEFEENKSTSKIDIADNTEKQTLDEIENGTSVNPAPNEKPSQEELIEEEEVPSPQRPEVKKITVTPENMDESSSEEETETNPNFIDQPRYESSASAPLVDIYLLDEDDELYIVEQDLGVNITVVTADGSGQSILIVPRVYHGVLKINQVSYDSDLNGYHIGEEFLNVYMSDNDAILFQVELSAEYPNILITYYDEQDNYYIQSLLNYSEEKGSISVNRGFNFVNY